MYKRKNIIELVNDTIMTFGQVKVECKLQEKIDEMDISLIELSHLTGIRYASLCDLKNNKKVTLNLQHLTAIMIALRIQSFDELFTLTFEDEEQSKMFSVESELYKKNGLPHDAIEQMKANKEILDKHYNKK
ncbi:helix-turn-helix domain-containing protein [Virgibacillus soli]|uniref:Helix-turn-helix transcriptional regulator n=1 Tax=Paracerasibacillus soli TaxID=480284 RepID=A0ABU5CS51_9BACI|nr:helix-turn-helix transcriptional regulator [Virgibacillus soli]MDY0409206.1 helix-turn-helix transcriptional regulator [Virgibacillus soli]